MRVGEFTARFCAPCDIDHDEPQHCPLHEDYEPGHRPGCVCADCSGAELTADND